ncbi:MAG: FaeA/PapI family transcriptional regulator [Halobacteriales archaeon]
MSEPATDRHRETEYIDAVRELEPAATSEVADRVGVARQSADYRLRQLEDEGKVRSKKIGSALAWMVAEERKEVREVDPRDPFWDAETYAGEAMSAGEIDDIVYGDTGE